jgi:RNA recognition motif. (a.k.a. RRM, RBD, or RNP domain)
MYDVSEEIIH